MKRLLLATACLFLILNSNAQEVKWSYSAKKAVAPDTYEVHLAATVETPWHIYSQFMEQGGPIPTAITFEEKAGVTTQGKTREVGRLQMQHVEAFNMTVKYFEDKVDFVQLIKVKTGISEVKGKISYMLCKEERCLPPVDILFSVKLQ